MKFKNTFIDMFDNAFIYGFLAYASTDILFQYFVGKEVYIKYIEKHWTDLHWGVGLSALIFSLLAYHFQRKKAIRLLLEGE